MNLEFLGKRIKAARDNKAMSRARVVTEIDRIRQNKKIVMENTLVMERTLIRWEQGKSKPKPENLRDLARVLDVPYQEEIYWLGIAGYLTPTPVPTEKQITSILDVYYEQIEQHPFPAFIVDYRNNIWAINPACSVFVGGYEIAVKLMKSQMFNLFTLSFNDDVNFGGNLAELNTFRRQQIVLFLLTNLYRRHEPFWESYPQSWENQFPQNYEQFEAIWNEVCKKYLDSLTASEALIEEVVKFSYVDFQTFSGSSIRFKVLAESPSYFSNNFFQVLYYTLADENDRSEAEKIFKEFWSKDTTKLKQWKLRDVNKILEKYM